MRKISVAIPASASVAWVAAWRVSLVTPTVRRWIEDGLRDPDEFWARAARELPWFRPWERVFAWNGVIRPSARMPSSRL